MSITNFKKLYKVLVDSNFSVSSAAVDNIEKANKYLAGSQMLQTTANAITHESFVSAARASMTDDQFNNFKQGAESLHQAYDNLNQYLSSAVTHEGVFDSSLVMTEVQKAVMLQSVAANSGKGRFDTQFKSRNIENVPVVSQEAVSSPMAMSTQKVLDAMGVTHESFDGADAKVNATYGMVLSAVTARPSDLLSLFFPSIVVKHDEHKFRMIIDVANYINEFTRERNDTIKEVKEKQGKLPMLKNLFNPDIMEKDITRLMPYTTGGANAEVTVPDISWVVKHAYEKFDTGFYKPELAIDVIGASQSDVDIKKTPADNTDTLLPTLKLEKMLVNIKTKTKTGGELVVFNVEDTPGSVFVAAQQGDVKSMQMNINEQVVTVKLGTTKAQSSAVASFGSVVDNAAFKGYVLKFQFSLSGLATLATSTVSVKQSGLKFMSLIAVYDANGVEIPLTSGSISNLVQEFTTIEFVGYTLIAYRSNTNFKKTGQFLELSAYGIEYAVNYKNPISVAGPINTFTGDTLLDWSVLKNTITAVSSACNYNGLTAIFKHAANLKQRTLVPYDRNDQTDYNMCNHIVDPYYQEVAIDFSNIDSLKSSDRMQDIQAAVLQKLTKIGMDMYLHSNYAIAFEEYYRQEGKKPTLILGTDILSASYITKGWTSNKIALNNILDLVVVTDIQPRLRTQENGKQVSGLGFLTFTLQDSIGEMTKPELLHFGFQCVSPVINVVIDNKPNNGGLIRQAFVLPRYDFFAMLPIMTVINFTGYSESIDKIHMNANIVTPKAKVMSSQIDGSVVAVQQD